MKNNKLVKKIKKQSGQAMLVVVGLLSVGLLMASTNIMIGIIQHDQALALSHSDQSRALVEGGVEEAVLRLLRDNSYSGGNLVIDGKNVTIKVTGDETNKTITSSVNYFGKNKLVQVEVVNISGIIEIDSWQDI